MAQNILVGVFDIESEGFQAFTELKQNPADEKYFLSQIVLTKKEDGSIKILDNFDTGADTLNDMAYGGLLGACLGVLGGPVGVLLAGSYGMLVGSIVDTGDAYNQASLIEQIALKMQDDDVVLIGLADEDDESVLDEKLSKFKTTIIRFDAAVVAQEVNEARLLEEEMARQAVASLRKEKNEEFKSKVEEHRAALKKDFEEIKGNFVKE